MSERNPRTINLYCPSASKTMEINVWDDQRLDLGSIARALGLDPPTVKLNGHFISRGLDSIACSVTWKSLLSFFAAKRLSAGKHPADAIVVDGKLSRVGTKRACDSQDSVNGTFSLNTVPKDSGSSGRSTLEGTNLANNKKMRNGNSGENSGDCRNSESQKGLGFKRKQLLEDLSMLKRLRINETCTGLSSDAPAKGDDAISKSISSTRLRCSPNRAMKRTREDDIDEAILTAPYKKTR